MPQRRKPPRLRLKNRPGRAPEWVIIDGRYERATGCGRRDEDGATRQLHRYIAETARPDTGQRDPARISVAEVLTLYMRDVAPHTAAPKLILYHSKPLLEFWGRKRLTDINGQSSREYATRRGKEVSLSTVRRELVTLQAAVNHWHKESPLDAVPRIVKPEESPARDRHLSRPEVARLLWAARRLGRLHIARFILLALYTGTRHTAILRLRWTPSADAGWLDYEKGVIYRAGTGERQTSKRRPPARIPDRLMVHVRAWAARDLEAGPQTAVIRWRGMPVIKERRAWETVCTAAGLEGVTPHTLKHTCATWALASGMSIWDLAQLLGTSMKTIEATYGHHAPEFQQAAAKAFRRTA